MGSLAATFAKEPLGAADLGDARLNQRLLAVAEQLAAHPDETFPKRFRHPAELEAFYRLLKNERVTHAQLMRPHVDVTLQQMRATPGVVLLLHDTTVLDYSARKAIAELGQIGNGHGRGIDGHHCLAVVAATRHVLGLAGQRLHRRRRAPKGETRKARQANPNRASRLWKTLSQSIPARPTDGPAGQWWSDIADRGADLTEFLDDEAQAGKKYVVRSQPNRWIEREMAGENGPTTAKVKRHDLARSLPDQGAPPIQVPAQNGPKARTAAVSVRWEQVTILPPRQRRGEERGVPLTCGVVRVGESNPPKGAEPLEGILRTNVPVGTRADALERIEWYRLRWIIEE